MPEFSSQASRRRGQANRLGLRTLGRIPSVVGQTGNGVPVFEAVGVELVLNEAAGHFCRFVHCARCGRGAVGAAILTRRDLDRPSDPIVCKDCVADAGVFGGQRALDWSDDDRVHGPSPSGTGEVVQPNVDLERTRDALRVAKALLCELEEARRSEWARRTEAVDAALGALEAAVSTDPDKELNRPDRPATALPQSRRGQPFAEDERRRPLAAASFPAPERKDPFRAVDMTIDPGGCAYT